MVFHSCGKKDMLEYGVHHTRKISYAPEKNGFEKKMVQIAKATNKLSNYPDNIY